MKCICGRNVIAIFRCKCHKFICKYCRYSHDLECLVKEKVVLPEKIKENKNMKDRI